MLNLKKSFLMGTAAGAAFIASAFFSILAVHAACTNPATIPTGFAAPCPVFSLSATTLTQSQTFTLSATPQPGTDYIYTTAYISEGTAWNPYTLSGNNAYPSYSSAAASYTLSSTQLQTLSLGTHYAVSWDWLWDQTAQCYKGPGLNQCNTGEWRVQAFSLTSAATPTPSPTPTACLTSSTAWQNQAIASQTGSFEVTFDTTPNAASVDALTGLSQNSAASYTDVATIIRFNSTGTIDARNGSVYQALTSISYAAGLAYHVRMDVNVPAHTYSIYVTPPGSAEKTIGTNFAFRTEQAAVTSLNYWNLWSDVSTHTVCNLAVTTSTYTYSQSAYYAYSQATYYVYSQSSYYAYSQSSYTSYTYSQSSYYAYSQSSYYAYSQAAYSGGTNYTVKAAGGGNFTTIQACANAMAAGDTCTVFVGTYNEVVTIPAGGVSSYKMLTVNGSDIANVYAFTINSHTKVIGFHINRPSSPNANHCVSVNSSATDFFITNNVMTACADGITIGNGSSHGFVQGNTISYTCSTPSAPNVCRGITNNGSFDLFENNDISHVSDAFAAFAGSRNIVRNNLIHDMTASDCGTNSSNCHIDFLESEPSVTTQFNVIEGNTELSNLGSNGHGYLSQGDVCGGNCNNTIIRYNSGLHVGGGGIIDDLGGFHDVKSYNNTWADFNQAIHSSGDITTHWSNNSYGGAAINSIFYYPEALTGFNPVACEGSSCSPFNHGHNLAFCTGGCTGMYGYQYGTGSWLSDTGNLQVDPKFVNYAGGDLHLQSTSPAIGAGTYLTTATNSGSGSTSLTVADAGYFQDGYGIPGVQPDWIRIGASTVVQISSINYSTNVIALAGPVTWTSGASVYLYKNSSGTTVLNGANPNIGAY